MTDHEHANRLPIWALRIFGAVSMLILGASITWLAYDRNLAWEIIHADRNRIVALEAQAEQLSEMRAELREMRALSRQEMADIQRQLTALTAAVAQVSATVNRQQ